MVSFLTHHPNSSKGSPGKVTMIVDFPRITNLKAENRGFSSTQPESKWRLASHLRTAQRVQIYLLLNDRFSFKKKMKISCSFTSRGPPEEQLLNLCKVILRSVRPKGIICEATLI